MKFAALLLFSSAVLATSTLAWALACLGVAVAAALLARVRMGALVWFTLLGASVTGAYQWLTRDAATAVNISADLVALVLATLAFSATTPVSRMMAAVTRAGRVLRPLGVDPPAVALTTGLVMTSVPRLAQVGAQVRAAALARGRERSPRAYLVPFVIRTVADARTTGEALVARGLAS